MDDNTRQVLIAIFSALGGLATGVLVAKLGFDHARSLDRERWQREDRYRSHADRVQAFGAFLVAMDEKLEWQIGAENRQRVKAITKEGPETIWDYDGPDPQVPLQTIAILAPDVEQPAEELHSWSVVQGLNQVRRNARMLGVPVPDEPPYIDSAEYHRLRDVVVAAMRSNLGVSNQGDSST